MRNGRNSHKVILLFLHALFLFTGQRLSNFHAHGEWHAALPHPMTRNYSMHNLLFPCTDIKNACSFSTISIRKSGVFYHKCAPHSMRSTLVGRGSILLMHPMWPFTFCTCSPLDVSIYFVTTFTLPTHFATFAATPQSHYSFSPLNVSMHQKKMLLQKQFHYPASLFLSSSFLFSSAKMLRC